MSRGKIMVTWSGVANVAAWVVFAPIGYMFAILNLTMFAQMLFSQAEDWPENTWEWFGQCVIAGFALLMIPFFLSFGHGFLHRLFSFRFPFAEGFFSFTNVATFLAALALSSVVAVITRRKYEKEKVEYAFLCWPLLIALVAWFNFGSAVFE